LILILKYGFYRASMPYKDPEKKKQCARKSYHKCKTKEKLEKDRLRMAEKRKDPELNKILQKRSRMNHWKNSMRYWGSWEELDEIYMATEICPLCNCKLSQENNSFQKSVDHDHFSKYVRDIICKNCNNKRGKVDRNKMFLHLELYRTTNKSN